MKPLTAERDGFSLDAAVACRGGERRKLERLCRDMACPAIALERLGRDGDGLVVYELEHALHDGTTHVLFEPLGFIARLAALGRRPRTHLVRCHGLFAPNALHRRLVVPGPARALASESCEPGATPSRTQLTWAQRLRRVFDSDISRGPRCGAASRVLAVTASAGSRRLRVIRATVRLARISPVLDTGADSRSGRLFVLSSGETRMYRLLGFRRGMARFSLARRKSLAHLAGQQRAFVAPLSNSAAPMAEEQRRCRQW